MGGFSMQRWAVIGLCGVVSACGSESSGGPGELVPPPPPSVTSFSPEAGPYGSEIAIKGDGLGSSLRSGVELVIGNVGERIVTPDDGELVLTWTESEVRFRYPFPIQGGVSIETPQGAAFAGEFVPSYEPGEGQELGPAAKATASVSPGAGRVAVLFAGAAAFVVEYDGQGVKKTTVDAGAADLSTLRLFANAAGEVEAVALSDADPPEVLHFSAATPGTLSPTATGLSGVWQEVFVSGGSDGAFVWMRDASGWSRASSASAFSVDLGPIKDPAPSGGLRAAGATSDGALHVAWNKSTGDLFDDTEAPYMASMPAGASSFALGKKVGLSMDDYLTEIMIETRGAGLILRYCASDVDPVLHTSADDTCKSSVRTSNGIVPAKNVIEDEQSRFVFTPEIAGAAQCGGDGLAVTVDLAKDPGEVVAWPCPRLLAVEIDAEGYFLPVVQEGGVAYSPRKRPSGG
jgi:hypothetical protein